MKKKAKRKVPVAIKIVLIILVVAMLFCGGMFAKMQYEQSIMKPLDTGEVIPGVYVINNGFVNFYLLQNDDRYLMVDAGNDVRNTEVALEQLKIPMDAIYAILLTHSDADHTTTLSLFPDAQIYLPALETQMIDGTTRRSPMGHNRLEQDHITLDDGEEINLLGFDVRCISTPGHTPGSMCFLIDGSYLFVGDTMSLNNGKADTFNAFYNMDSGTQRESIRKLATSTHPEYIFTAHYGYTDDTETAFEEWY